MDGWMDMELIQNKSQEEPKRPLNYSLEQIDKRYRIVENFSVFLNHIFSLLGSEQVQKGVRKYLEHLMI